MNPIPTQEDELSALLDELEAMVNESPAPVVAAPAPEALPPEEEILNAVNQELDALDALDEPEAAPAPEPVVTPSESAPVVASGSVLVSMAAAPAATPKPAAATVKVGGVSGLLYEISLASFKAETDITDLDNAMLHHSGLRAYYNTQAALAEAQADRVKHQFEVVEASLYHEYRTAAAAGGEKVTDKAIESAVKRDPRWLAAKNRHIDAKAIADVNKGYTFAMADRRDMMIQLGSDRREEMKGALRINGQSNATIQLGDAARAAARGALQ